MPANSPLGTPAAGTQSAATAAGTFASEVRAELPVHPCARWSSSRAGEAVVAAAVTGSTVEVGGPTVGGQSQAGLASVLGVEALPAFVKRSNS